MLLKSGLFLLRNIANIAIVILEKFILQAKLQQLACSTNKS